MRYGYSSAVTLDDVTRIRGLNLLIAATFDHYTNAPDQWRDMRPEYLITMSQPDYRGYPIWWDPDTDTRHRRRIKITDSTLLKIAKVGIYHEIVDPIRPTRTIHNMTERATVVLEAWGQKNIWPPEIPENPKTLTRGKTYIDVPLY